ncbi:MAG: PAS domain S-box protein [Nitrospirae bacterium]|nr:MAG: PAS domain S-box protein [Nitrospirota bacterium]
MSLVEDYCIDSHNPFRNLIEHIPLVTYSASFEDGFRLIYISPQVETMLGFPPSYWTSTQDCYIRHIHPDDRERVLKAKTNSAMSRTTFGADYRMLTAEGQSIWVRDQAHIVSSKERGALFQGVLFDISSDQQLAEELGRWDAEARSLAEHLPVILARFDRHLRFLYANRWLRSDRCLAPEAYLGKTLQELEDDEHVVKSWTETIQKVFADDRPRRLEFSMATPQGRKHYESHFVPEYGPKGYVEVVLTVTNDLTHRKETEASLYESEARFRQLAESIDDVFWLADAASEKILYVSPAYERLWGATARTLYQRSSAWLDLVHPDDRATVRERFRDRVQRGGYSGEYRLLRSDRTIRWVYERTFPIKTPDGRVHRVAGIVEDITDRKRYEEERLRMNKLDSLGLLAGGLAHDFNNLLTAILGQLTLAKLALSPHDRLFQRLTEAEAASLRAQELTNQLLTFAKGGLPIKKAASLRQLVEESARFVLRGSNVKCQFRFASDLWPVEIDVGQIGQVIQNLVINAKQAMPDGGVVTIQGENVVITAGDRPPGSLDLSAGHWVRVTFADRGVGIPAENLEKIFDPYFTTKPTGSGLGLATSYSIVKKHGGVLSVASQVGVGTTFTLYLPAMPSASVEHSQEDSLAVESGCGRILIMDDEEPIRRLLNDMLELCGYTCELAKDGYEALKMFERARSEGQPFHVVLLDLTVPGGMGGKETFQRLKELDPQIKAVVMSGYSNDPILARYQDYGFHARITKPFKFRELAEVVRNVLSIRTNHGDNRSTDPCKLR